MIGGFPVRNLLQDGLGFKVLRNVIHDNYIQRPNERGKQVGSEGVSPRKSYCPRGVLPWELIKPGTRVLTL